MTDSSAGRADFVKRGLHDLLRHLRAKLRWAKELV